MPAELGRRGEVDAADGELELPGELRPGRSGLGVGVCVVFFSFRWYSQSR